jgi:hypothetical protein
MRFMFNHILTCNYYKIFFTKFDVINVKIKQRENITENSNATVRNLGNLEWKKTQEE